MNDINRDYRAERVLRALYSEWIELNQVKDPKFTHPGDSDFDVEQYKIQLFGIAEAAQSLADNLRANLTDETESDRKVSRNGYFYRGLIKTLNYRIKNML